MKAFVITSLSPLLIITLMTSILMTESLRTENKNGQLSVTMGIFSGRRDPQWVIPANNPSMRNIQLLLATAKKAGALHARDEMPARLGYKGFLVVYDQVERLILGPKTVPLQEALFATMPQGAIPNKIVARTLATIKAGTVLPEVKSRGKRHKPPFNPAPWMNDIVRGNNNCYNYANIKITNTFAQPGRGSTGIYTAMTAAAVRAASVNDGLVIAANGNFPARTRHVVALVVEDGVDFHWYLRDSDGKWSHKPGTCSVTRTDNSGNLITDPSSASVDMNGYRFVCFMTTDRNTVTIN